MTERIPHVGRIALSGPEGMTGDGKVYTKAAVRSFAAQMEAHGCKVRLVEREDGELEAWVIVHVEPMEYNVIPRSILGLEGEAEA